MNNARTTAVILRIVGISLSLPFLYFIRVYRQLLYPAYDWYFEYEVPNLEILTTLFCSFLLFGVFFGLLLLISRQPKGLRKRNLQIIFVALAVAGFGPLSGELLNWWFLDYEPWFKYPIPLLLVLTCFLLPGNGDGRLSRAIGNLGTAVLFILPAALFTFCHALSLATGIVHKDLEPNSIETALETSKPEKRLPRVVWIIFDELDYSAMSQKPANIRLPAFDDLAATSLVAENAFPPHFWTSVSVPALLTGREIYWAEPHASDKLTLNFSDGPPVELQETETVFDDVVALKGKAAAAGWYHPYPRLFKKSLAFGYWAPRSTYRCRSFTECALSTFVSSFESASPLKDSDESLFPQTRQNSPIHERFFFYREHAEYNRFLRERAANLVANENIDIAFLHFPIPHYPFLNRSDELAETYFEALEAADETLLILGKAMKSTDIWDRTTVIVSSDHWMRTSLNLTYGEPAKEEFALENTRIPFIVKPAGAGKPLEYHPRFNTLITRYLIKSILSGEVRTTEEIGAWLDRAATERPELVSFHPCRGIENLNAVVSNGSSSPILTCK